MKMLRLLYYAIAMLVAIEIWRNALENQAAALEQYRYALSLGNTKSLPELFEAAGATFSFEREHVAQLMVFLKEQLEL